MSIGRALESQVRARALNRCEYCHVPEELDPLPFQIDHIVARVHRGRSTADNLALACFACNHHKGTNLSGIDPVTKGIVRLHHPRQSAWSRHFRWWGARILGRSACGRATVEVLKLNLPYRIALRAALMVEGVLRRK